MASSGQQGIRRTNKEELRHLLEVRLSELHHQDRPISVSRHGAILDPGDRTEFYTHLFASFRRRKDGEIELRGGKASENGTYTADPDGKNLVKISSPVKVISGQQIVLSRRAQFSVPYDDSLQYSCKAEELLFNLRPGARCSLGRNDVDPVHPEVSAQHITVLRLRDDGDTRVYLLFDGIHAEGGVPLVDLEAGQWTEAYDWTPVASGRVIKLGKGGSVLQIPLWKRDPTAQPGKEYYLEDIPMRVSSHTLTFPVDIQYLRKVPVARHRAIEVFQRELAKVFRLVRDSRFETAHAKLLSTLHLSETGMKHEINEGHATFSPTGDLQGDAQQIDQIFSFLAERVRPSTDHDLLRIDSARFESSEALELQPERLKDIKEVFYSMLVPFECEQWCFAYQNLLGGYISKQAALIDGYENARELDSLLFMNEQGVIPLARHIKLFGRQKVHTLLKASENFEALMNCSAALTRSIDDLRPGFELTVSEQSPEFLRFVGFPGEVASELFSFELTIIPERSGGYFIRVSQTDGKFQLFVRNSNAMWEPVEKEIALPGKSFIRFGRFLEVQCP